MVVDSTWGQSQFLRLGKASLADSLESLVRTKGGSESLVNYLPGDGADNTPGMLINLCNLSED
ncbi:MAG: hypothetical protein A2Z73_02400 [Deltaproteobacteria bacterium RBG_13_60_28]|nr:MAG: hypothetical protein A2Z73_02400 [Deltaproteobacteria bacterium RBG_13_60_28]